MANNPIITCSVRDTNELTKALTGNDQVLIRHKSWAEASMSVTAQGGAAIDLDMCLIRNGGATVFGTSGTFKSVPSNVFVFSAADSEGRTAQETKIVNMIDYIKLTCNVGLTRIDALGSATLSCGGDYFNGSFGAKANTLTVNCRYRETGGAWSSEYSMTISTSGNSYAATKNLTGLSQKKTYEFQFLAEDRLTSASGESGNISSTPVFHWGRNDVIFEVPISVKGTATFTEEVTFDGGTKGVTMPEEIDGNLRITGDLRLKGGDNYGNTLFFGDGSYCYISEDTDDDMTIHADSLNLSVNSFTINGESALEFGDWTPALSLDDVNYYNQFGWYSKIGNVVTIGFYLKAYCYDGYEDVKIVIYGMPYEPCCEASGGGMCSGALISSDKNFQCFVAESSGEITLRAQACDNTNDTYLSTSATACFYPGNKTLTLSGTITFTI